MTRIHVKALWLILIAVFAGGCDEGLKPAAPVIPTGYMSGLIRFQHWPPPDSLVDLRIVAFRVFPPMNIPTEVQLGRVAIYPPLGDTTHLPFHVDSTRYGFALQAGEYPYVIVAQRYGQNILADWRVVGQFDLDSILTVPSLVTILENDTTFNINISVDFSNPPPPPF